MVAVRHHLRKARGGELRRDGVFYNNPLHDAHICHHVNRLLPMEDEQGTRFHHVLAVFRIRGGIADVRIRVHSVSCLEYCTQH